MKNNKQSIEISFSNYDTSLLNKQLNLFAVGVLVSLFQRITSINYGTI